MRTKCHQAKANTRCKDDYKAVLSNRFSKDKIMLGNNFSYYILHNVIHVTYNICNTTVM